ncbi:transmembrane protein 138 isoform X1 [Sciurus carolinensis]|uniref:transmembrane protein 138 isoform X1 n=1 Tax=Sciurus carolinensis TaxID=30640 RepID=UPI001FB2E970|nr:transmembrane protein 138 isoform X1 [Sciurus carolinensis]
MFGSMQCFPPGSDPKPGLTRRGWEPRSAKGDNGTARTWQAQKSKARTWLLGCGRAGRGSRGQRADRARVGPLLPEFKAGFRKPECCRHDNRRRFFEAGLVNLLFHKFKGTIILTAVYFALSISFHVWVMNLRWKNSNSFVWTDGLQTLFVFQRLAAVLYYYFYKRTAMRLGDPRFYQDSLWLRKEFMQVRR